MNLLNYKQDKVAVPDKEMLLVKDQYLYEINGLDMGKSVVLYKKELEIFKPMPKGDYKIIYQENNQYIQVTNEDIFKDYYAIQVVSITKLISSMYEPQGDIDINIVLHELNNTISDLHGVVDYIKKVNFVVDSTKSTNVFPDLPIGSTVIRLEDGTLGAIPVSDMYEHFDRLTERIYNTVTGWLETDHQKFIQDMKEYKDELEKELKQLSDKLANDLQELFNQKSEEFKQYIDDDLKPILLKYVNEVLKPELKSYVETLKLELNTYTTTTLFGKLDTKTIECINKVEAKCNECIAKLNTHTENKKKDLDAKTENLKGDLNTHSEIKKQDISAHAIEVKNNLVVEIKKEGDKQKTEVIETGDKVKEDINGLIPDNLGIRVEQLEKDRVKKAGDTMTGSLEINTNTDTKLLFKNSGTESGSIKSNESSFTINNSVSNKSISMNNDGTITIPSSDLITPTKEVVESVNEVARGFAKYERTTSDCNNISGDGYWATTINATDGPIIDSCLIFQREYGEYRYQEAYGYYAEGQHWRRFFKIETGGVGVAWTKVLSTGSTDDVILTQGNQNKYGNLSILNSYVAGDGVVIRNEGDIQLTRATSNPNVSFKNNSTQGYVGAVLNEGIRIQNSTLGSSTTWAQDGGIINNADYFEIKTGESGHTMLTTKSANVGLEWWKGSKLSFKNDGKIATFTGLGNQARFVFYSEVNAYPHFSLVNGATGAEQIISLVDLAGNYLDKRYGGTITGAVDIQGAFSANSFYSRGTIVGAGAISSSGNVTAYSDIKLKENLSPLENCLDLIQKLEVYKYNWKDTKQEDIGVIAQEVENVFPEFVVEVQDETKGSVKTVDYAKLATISLKGIKEILDIVEDLTDRVEALERGL